MVSLLLITVPTIYLWVSKCNCHIYIRNLVQYLTNTGRHQNYRKAIVSGYTTLLPRTGMWYLSSFQNLEEGERDVDSCESVPLFSTSAPLMHVFHLCLVLWFFHQHTAPCFFLRWRTDSGNRASWAGVISSSSTRTTCTAELRLDSV